MAKIEKISSTDTLNAGREKINTAIDALVNSSGNTVNVGFTESFDTLTALKSKYPSGRDGMFFVFDNGNSDGGHSYIWSENAWKDLGVYQSKGIADKSVTASKISDNAVTSNTIADSAVSQKKYVRGSITPDKTFILTSGENIYDPSKNEIGAIRPESGLNLDSDAHVRTGYIDISNSTSIIIHDIEKKMTNSVYVFTYDEIGKEAIDKYGPLASETAKYVINTKNRKYLRTTIKGSVFDAVGSLEILYFNGNQIDTAIDQNNKILKSNVLDSRFVKNKNIATPNGLYNPTYDEVGGLTWEGLDELASDFPNYKRTGYIPLADGNVADGLDILISRKYGYSINTDFIFLYSSANRDLRGTSLTSLGISNADSKTEFSFVVPNGGYRFMRLVSVSPTYPENTLSVHNTSNRNGVVINGYNLDQRYLQLGDIQGGEGNFSKRPENGIYNFKVEINNDLRHSSSSNTLDPQDYYTVDYDDCVLFLPTNYLSGGRKTRLIIGCHGAGTTITSTTTSLSSPLNYFLKLGYAVLDCNGVPKSLSNNTGLHYGSPLAMQSYIKAYRHVIEKFNLTREVFLYGISMGGLSSNMIALSESIPIIAQGNMCPVTDHFKQAYCRPWNDGASQRSQIAKLFGFTGTAPTWSNGSYPTQEEIDYYMQNLDKVIGYNPMLRNSNFNAIDLYATRNDTTDSVATEETIYNKLTKYHPVPLKIWHNDDDPTVLPRYSEYYVNAIRRNGGLAYMRKLPSGGHNAWENGNTTAVTDIDGNNMNVPATVYEMYLWFKRFE